MKPHPENLTFDYAKDFKSDVSSVLQSSRKKIVDLSNTERASFACIQVILCAVQDANRNNAKLQFKVSPRLQSIFQELGVDKIMDKERILQQ